MAVGEIRRVGVVGAGTMGSGIAQIVAAHDIPVAFVEVDGACGFGRCSHSRD